MQRVRDFSTLTLFQHSEPQRNIADAKLWINASYVISDATTKDHGRIGKKAPFPQSSNVDFPRKAKSISLKNMAKGRQQGVGRTNKSEFGILVDNVHLSP